MSVPHELATLKPSGLVHRGVSFVWAVVIRQLPITESNRFASWGWVALAYPRSREAPLSHSVLLGSIYS
jgi:hypothetical protein